MAGAKDETAVFLAASLCGKAQKVLNGMSDSDCQNYPKIVDKLELWCGKTTRVTPGASTVNNRYMKVFKLYVQSSV